MNPVTTDRESRQERKRVRARAQLARIDWKIHRLREALRQIGEDFRMVRRLAERHSVIVSAGD